MLLNLITRFLSRTGARSQAHIWVQKKTKNECTLDLVKVRAPHEKFEAETILRPLVAIGMELYLDFKLIRQLRYIDSQ